ncbi:MAG: hypothetical protein Ta2A_14180 [Treponemataceae bacterium]|nr:MAG: hypothetical protein Ta2A_14180 [Treponemataceae bacterium]
MNTNFLNIVRRIVAEQGEGILADAQRLKGIVKDYAKNEAQEERVAFGRCIEAGCYNELKRAATPQERAQVKAALSRRVAASSGIDPSRCAAALDVLEAAISPPPQPQWGTQSAAPASGGAFTMPSAKTMPKVSRKTLIFGIASGVGAFVGDMIGEFLTNNDSQTNADLILSVGVWGAFIGLGISAALLLAQTFSTKKKPDMPQLLKTLAIGFGVGAFSGGLAQFIFNYTQYISPAVRTISNALCWGVMGTGLGLSAAFYVPNYPPKRATLAGAIGGTLGGIIYVAMLGSGGYWGSIIGVIVLGAAIGLAISFIEEALRDAWLTIVWGPKENTTVALGEKPVSFGTSREVDVYLPQRQGEPPAPAIRAIFKIENGKIVMEDRLTNRRGELRDGDRIDLGRVNIVVNTKK